MRRHRPVCEAELCSISVRLDKPTTPTLMIHGTEDTDVFLVFDLLARDGSERPWDDLLAEFEKVAVFLDDNERAHGIWAANGYRRQEEWSRWIKPL